MPNRRKFDHIANFTPVTEDGVTIGVVDKKGKASYVNQAHPKLRTLGSAKAMRYVEEKAASQRPDPDLVGLVAGGVFAGRRTIYGLKTTTIIEGEEVLRISRTLPDNIVENPGRTPREIFSQARSPVVLEAEGTESGAGTINLTLAVPVPRGSALLGALVLDFDQRAERPVTKRGSVTMTFAPEEQNADNIGESFVGDAAGAQIFLSTPDLVTNVVHFDMGVGRARAVHFFHLRPSGSLSFGEAVLSRAMVRTPENQASTEVDTLNIAVAVACAAGGNLSLGVAGVFPGASDYAECSRLAMVS